MENWTLIGKIASGLEHKDFPNGAIDSLRIATFGGYRINEAKEKVELTTWVNVHLKNPKDLILAKTLKKGDQVTITGYVKMAKPYTSKKDGIERSALTFVAEHVLYS